jgi:hypothetical protein
MRRIRLTLSPVERGLPAEGGLQASPCRAGFERPLLLSPIFCSWPASAGQAGRLMQKVVALGVLKYSAALPAQTVTDPPELVLLCSGEVRV